MNRPFKATTLVIVLTLAFAGFPLPVVAAGPYPALPPALSSSAPPNVMLLIDNSSTMGQAYNGNSVTPTKMDVAKSLANTLVTNKPNLNWGIFSYDDRVSGTPPPYSGAAGILQARVGSTTSDLKTTINNLSALNTAQKPLGEALFEITRYFDGDTSLYKKILANAQSQNYTSPIQYRCQNNFVIIITDSGSTRDDELPSANSSDCPLGILNRITTTNATEFPQNPRRYVSYTYDVFNQQYTRPVNDKTFNICSQWVSARSLTDGTTAVTPGITAAGISCPTYLENSSLTNSGTLHPFNVTPTDTIPSCNSYYNTYPAGIRDVAAYAFDKNLGYLGTDYDVEGVSFTDQKFIKRTLNTSVVSFSATDAILKATAAVGRGKFYFADPNIPTAQSDLVKSLSDTLASAADHIQASNSNAGGVATLSEISGIGNWQFQPVFNPRAWYGELRCLQPGVDASGNATGTFVNCINKPKATIPYFSFRNVYSANVTGTNTTSFDFNSSRPNINRMTELEQNLLGTTYEERGDLINYLLGQEGLTGFRLRPKDSNGNTIFLGDIIDAQPVVVGAPIGESADPDYEKFKNDNASRGLVFIGANDGMLHAFNIADANGKSDMSEIMAYVPSAVYPRLATLKALDYGTSATNPHTYHVNGTAQSLDIKLGNNWTTLLVGGLGQGGQGYYAIDATNPTKLGRNTAIKWEWTDVSDPNMGYSFGKPIIYNVRKTATTSQPAVILSNGYDNDFDNNGVLKDPAFPKTSALYILNANDGTPIKIILLPPELSSTGLSSPVGVDFGQDGVLDYVYAGDMSGKLWRFDLTNANPDNFNVYSTPIFDAGITQPISNRPAVIAVNDNKTAASLGNLILFGTGKLLTDDDREDPSVQSFYAVLDDMTSTQGTVTQNLLLEQTLSNPPTTTLPATGYRAGTYRKVSTHEYDTYPTFDLRSASETKKGWHINFPVSTERLVTSPLLIADKLIFGTGIPRSGPICQPGQGWIMGLNPFTGSIVRTSSGKDYSFIDIQLDEKSTSADKISFATGAAYASGYQKDGIPTELSYTSALQTIINPFITGDSGIGKWGSRIAMRDINYMGVYGGNAAHGTTKGTSVNQGTVGGVVNVTDCIIGTEGCPQTPLLTQPSGGPYKVLSTTWRELK